MKKAMLCLGLLWCIGTPCHASGKKTAKATAGLQLVQGDPGKCRQVRELIDAKPICRIFDGKFDSGECARTKPNDEANIYWDPVRLVLNERQTFGYTWFFRATYPKKTRFSMVYVDDLDAERLPRVLATWKIDSNRLDSLLAKFPDELIPKVEHWIDRKTLPAALEFAHLLKSSEKISDELSPGFFMDGYFHAVVRSCRGSWAIDNTYHCSSVRSLRVVKITDEEASLTVCEFGRRH